MALNRRVVRAAAFLVPLAMFLAIPLLGLALSPFFGLYIVAYVVTGSLLAYLKWKVDGSLWW